MSVWIVSKSDIYMDKQMHFCEKKMASKLQYGF